MKKVILIVAATIIVAGGLFAVFFYQSNINPVSNDDQMVVFTVESGATLNGVLVDLEEAQLISNEMVARIYCRLNDVAGVQANSYELNQSMSLAKILDIIATGDPEYVIMAQVTLLDGNRISDFAKALEAASIDSEEFMSYINDRDNLKGWIEEYWWLSDEILEDGIRYPLEGYLAPDTYLIQESDRMIEQLVEAMLVQTDKILTPLKDSIDNFEIDGTSQSAHQFVTLASIVQSESLNAKDALMITGVFVNRIEANMPLQSDVTVNYANEVVKVAVTYDDLEVDSKYNTYMYRGLPVGPIATIDKDIFVSVLNYTPNDYYYFFATQDGTVIYSRSYSEHLRVIEENKWY